jgi:magnesium transporter
MDKIRNKLVDTHKEGLQPGVLMHAGDHDISPLNMLVTDYGPEEAKTFKSSNIDDILGSNPGLCGNREPGKIRWVHFHGLPESAIIEKMGKHLGLHNLIMEDILHTTQRPKMEELEGIKFITLRRPFKKWHKQDSAMSNEQISILATPGWVISLESFPADFFEPVRERIMGNKGRIRKMGTDYLLYALMDRTADSYFTIFEKISEQSSALEEAIITDPKPEHLRSIHSLRRILTVMRKAVWPLRDICAEMIREMKTPDSSEDNSQDITPFLRDLQDHALRLMDSLETNRDLVSSLQDLHLSTVGNRTNDIMKVLTIISTCFMPMTFIAGVYGMNFDIIPELKWTNGYFYAWGLMIIAALSMLSFFRNKKWL